MQMGNRMCSKNKFWSRLKNLRIAGNIVGAILLLPLMGARDGLARVALVDAIFTVRMIC